MTKKTIVVVECLCCPFEFCGYCQHPSMPTGRKAKEAHQCDVRSDCPLIGKVSNFGVHKYTV